MEKAIHLKKFTVDANKEQEEHFKIEYEVTEDSAEQILVKQYSCEACEFDDDYLTTWKGTNWKSKEF